MTSLLDPQQTYTFSKIFDLKIEAEDIALEFGYSLTRAQLQLPKYTGTLDIPHLPQLKGSLPAVANKC